MTVTIIAKGTIKSGWYKTYAPNGCVPPSTERTCTEVTVYETDQFFNKLHRYAGGREYLEFEDGRTSDTINLWDDGEPARVQRWLERITS